MSESTAATAPYRPGYSNQVLILNDELEIVGRMEAVMNPFSTFLFASSGFRTGIARAFDIGGQFSGYNSSVSPYAADACALYADWRAVGNDLRSGMHTYRSNPNQLNLFDNPTRQKFSTRNGPHVD